jgi:GNAT superfamily N-acetyltransferase
MSVSALFTRLVEYQKRHGLRAALRRAGIAARRAVSAGDMVVFYCDLDPDRLRAVKCPAGFSIERLESQTDLTSADFEQVTSFWNPRLASANIRERFESGAVLWLIKSGESVAGYGWTLRGGSIEPYYFPLGADDVHLFDFYVFPEFRGRGINPGLVGSILSEMVKTCDGRAFIEAAEWNTNQLLSLRKTSFRRLGRVRIFRVFRRLLIHWKPSEPVIEPRSVVTRTGKVSGMLRSNE